jgi:hypothetical protein
MQRPVPQTALRISVLCTIILSVASVHSATLDFKSVPIEATVLLELLHFGTGSQAIHYFVLCLGGTLGIVQAAAVRYDRRDLIWIAERGGYVFSLVMVASSFMWFLRADKEIFIPGLAGGELFVIFIAALLVAVPATRAVNWVLVRLRLLALVPEPNLREKEPLL